MDDLLLVNTPADVEASLAQRVRAARRAKGWSQAELAKRSGLSIATVARFEQSGQGQVSTLIHLCFALGHMDDLTALLREPAPASLAALRRVRAAERAS